MNLWVGCIFVKSWTLPAFLIFMLLSIATPISATGLGVFLINQGALSSTIVYVLARINNIQSALMALCLATKLAKQPSLNSVNFLIDNQSIADLYNSSDLSRPLHWNIKAYTVAFLQGMERKDYVVSKVKAAESHNSYFSTLGFTLVANCTAFSCSCTLNFSNHITAHLGGTTTSKLRALTPNCKGMYNAL